MKYYKKKGSKSDRAKICQTIQNVMRNILKLTRGEKCELCGSEGKVLGVFHILPVGSHPALRFTFENVLLSCWFPCHFSWHHDYEKAVKIKDKIVQLRGKNYKFDLYQIERNIPQMTRVYLEDKLQEMLAYQEKVKNKKEIQDVKGY